MHQNISTSETTNNEINILQILNFCKKNWKIILGIGFIWTISFYFFLAITPPQYEAKALIAMASINDVNFSSINILETPELLIERLKQPSAYTLETMKVCGVANQSFPAEMMASVIKANSIHKLNSIVEISARRNSPELAKQCLSSVIDMIRSQQAALAKPYQNEIKNTLHTLQNQLRDNLAFIKNASNQNFNYGAYVIKRDELFYLKTQIAELERIILHISSTRAISPVYASPQAVSLNKLLKLAWSFLCGLVLGVLIAISWEIFSRWRASLLASA